MARHSLQLAVYPRVHHDPFRRFANSLAISPSYSSYPVNKTLFSQLFSVLLLALSLSLVGACQSDDPFALHGEGGLRVALDRVAPSVVTRTAPADLPRPDASKFSLEVANAEGKTFYRGRFTNDIIHLIGGNYTVTATYGTNPELGIEAPYYVGSEQVEVVTDEVTDAAITCKVGNALLSVKFGRDEVERARFEKHYTDYAVNVSLGDKSVSIDRDNSYRSAYFQAGTTGLVLEFSGTLAQNSQHVSTTLDYSAIDNFPQTFQAADHVIVTLSLPEPESAAVVNISKVELEEATLENTIPLSWLPLPQVDAEHQYDANNDLCGTDLHFTQGYPGMKWTAEITDAHGTLVRTIESESTQISDNADIAAQDWPYLPQGSYTATYFVLINGEAKKTGTRSFNVAMPDLHLDLTGYTSHSKYMEGDVDAANACDGHTVYDLSVHFNVAPSLFQKPIYGGKVGCKYKGVEKAAGSQPLITLGNQQENASASAYRLEASVSFAGASYQASRDLMVTGLPVTFAPPSESNGWAKGGGTVTFSANEVKLGHRGGILTENDENILNASTVVIPSGTLLAVDYDFMIHPATMGTTFTITDNGSQTIFTQQRNGGVMNNNDYPFQGTATFQVESPITTLKLNNSYGGGQTRTHVYSLIFKYGK